MEYLVLIIVIILLLIFIFVREAIAAKIKEKRFIESLYHISEELPQREYTLERFAKIGSYYKKHQADGLVDDITWNDLDLDEIFKRINYTFSASGEEYLYYRLRNTNQSVEELEHLETIIRFFEENPDIRVKVQYRMSQLGYTGKFSLYDYIDHLDFLGERSNRRHILCNLLFLPLIGLAFIQPGLGFMSIALLIVYNIVTYFKEKGEIDPYITSFAYVNRLLETGLELQKLSAPACEQEWQAMKGYLEQLNGLRRGSFWVFTSNQGKITGNPLDIIMDYLRMMFHIDLIQFNRMLSHLREHITAVDELIGTVGYLESAIAIGIFRDSVKHVDSGKEVCVPQFGGEELSIKAAYHPLIAEPVKNSIEAKRGVLITGSNASGKSTFLKTVAINAILAQTIHTCCAAQYKAPLYSIYSSMALHDDLGSGESYYIVEIKALKRILDVAATSERKVLCFVDEVLRGTNTVERIAASTQILASLSDSGRMLCFAATHDIELTELLKDCYDNYHFEEDVIDGDIFFPYKIMSGPTRTRNAIKLLEIMGYDAAVIKRASKQAERFMTSGAWSV